MKAVVIDTFGPPEVLRIDEVERPATRDDEMLVRVHASTVTRSDTGLRMAEYGRLITGLRGPRQRIPGIEFAGVVEAGGPHVPGPSVGDRVFGIAPGSNAQFVRIRRRDAVAPMPSNTSFDEAAAIPDGGCTALSFLRQVRFREGQRILIYGAGGSIGTASVQIASQRGGIVTAVCDTGQVELVRSLGADRVLDRLREDHAETGETYDVVLDAVGLMPPRSWRRSLEPSGVYITAGSPGTIGRVLLSALATSVVRRRKVRLGIARYRSDDVRELARLVEEGRYRPVIDRRYALDDVVDAHRYVDTQQKTGNVVLVIDRNDG